MMKTDVVIFGAGGLSREVAWLLEMPGAQLHWQGDRAPSDIRLLGHLDDRPEMHGTQVNHLPVLGGMEWLTRKPGHAVIVAVGNSGIRRQVVTRLGALGATFPSILAPGTVIGSHGSLGEGVIALPGVVVTSNVSIGDFVLFNPNVTVSHEVSIGDYCSIGSGVSLTGNVQIGAGTDIGANASVIPRTNIGANTVIGAGACVTRDLPDSVTAVGVPARVIKTADSSVGE